MSASYRKMTVFQKGHNCRRTGSMIASFEQLTISNILGQYIDTHPSTSLVPGRY